ncbi:hypothetical protein BEWA_007670 [Theileria equi strain WA]|uniref:Uncharacterized protein n=1 Tax=Theileria equi strain WA TaxID=1537102 RepID=L0B1I6_THEEQ|nr:hypothetical protein BEWA_007670 [Theileria equi strain WA]AFZ81358.1 hypothetical protein BEWA_007670 [Theileria equi strain WA]|eukprot:XP_004831024.1 hypothetical protein BEWA_007670 [Theileria equi strain WA]
MMIFLEHSGLSKIAALLHSFDATDRLFDAKLELVSYSRSNNILKDDINIHPPHLSDDDIITHFKTLMNKCFPDYDFSNINHTYFKEVKNLDIVINTVYYNLSFIVGRLLPNFADEFWQTIKQVISIKDVDIYTYDSSGEDDPFNSETCLNSFNYFLLDKRQQHILFVSCISRSRNDSRYKNNEEPQLFHSSIYADTLSTKSEEDCLSEIEVPETFMVNVKNSF